MKYYMRNLSIEECSRAFRAWADDQGISGSSRKLAEAAWIASSSAILHCIQDEMDEKNERASTGG